jgi:hypothetical protein
MPDPPSTAAWGRARRGSSPSSNTAPGFSPTGASRLTPPVLDFPPDRPLRRSRAARQRARFAVGRGANRIPEPIKSSRKELDRVRFHPYSVLRSYGVPNISFLDGRQDRHHRTHTPGLSSSEYSLAFLLRASVVHHRRAQGGPPMRRSIRSTLAEVSGIRTSRGHRRPRPSRPACRIAASPRPTRPGE